MFNRPPQILPAAVASVAAGKASMEPAYMPSQAVRTSAPSSSKFRVSTFYSAPTSTYSETYEPPRITAFGRIAVIESRFVSGRWKHTAFSEEGKRITDECGHVLFDEGRLPLLFKPDQEKQFASATLGTDASVVWIGHEVMVHGSRDGKSVGVIRFYHEPPI